MAYSNAQIRSILNGLGYRSQLQSSDPNFPLSEDDSPLADEPTIKAVMKFQVDYSLTVDGIVGQQTTSTMQVEMNSLHIELNEVVNTGISEDEPYFGPQTLAAIKQFQQQQQPDGIASFPLREELYSAVNTVNPVAVAS
jgi:peptidoglycan hydrolase-like protein with peptidoglycan-binding domain